MNLRKLGIAVVVAGLLQAGAALSLTVTPMESRILLTTEVRQKGGSHPPAHTASDGQYDTLQSLAATSSVTDQIRDQSVSAYNHMEASWDDAATGHLKFDYLYETANAEFPWINTRGGAQFVYRFSIDEPAYFSIDLKRSIKSGSGDRFGLGSFAGSLTGYGPGATLSHYWRLIIATTSKMTYSGWLRTGTYDLLMSSGAEFGLGSGVTRRAGYDLTADWTIKEGPTVVPVPLPAALLLTGLGGLGVVARRRRQG